MATEKFSNNAATTLSGAISDSALSLVVSSATGFPTSGQFRVKIDNELILVTGVSGTTYTITRGQEGTTAVAHGDGAAVTHVLTAGALTQLQADTFTAGGDLSGTSTSQTVTKIQGTALDPAMSAVALNDVLTWDGSKWTHSSSAPITTRYTQPNPTGTVIHWRLNELSTPWTNTGTAGTLNLTPISSAPVASGGLFDSSLLFNGSILTTGDTSVGELASTSISISAWVLLTAYTAYANVVTKNYHSGGGFSSPFSSISLQCNSSGNGLQSPISTVGGSNPQYSVAPIGVIPLGIWTLLSLTYDGAHFVEYINGNVAASLAVTGAIDWGTHGPWTVGGNGASARALYGSIEDVRIESVVRSQAYYREMYKKGVGLFDQYQGSNGSNLMPHLPILSGVESESLNGWKVVGSISFNPSDYNYTQAVLEVLLATSNASNAAKARLWNVTTGAQVGTDLSSTSTSTERVTQIITPTSGVNIYEVQIQTASSGTDAICYGARFNLTGGVGAAPVFVNVTANTTRSAGVNETLVIGTLTSAITVTFPASPTTGQTIKIKDSGGTIGTYNVTVSGNGNTLDGASTFVMAQNYAQNEFTYNGTSWMVG